MYFKGDIIITDPCYIMNKDNSDDIANAPRWWNYISKVHCEIKIDKNGKEYESYSLPKPEDYPDCQDKSFDECNNLEKALYSIHNKIPKISPTLQKEWDEYHKADDEWHNVPHGDWERCECGDNMEVLGLNTYLSRGTIYGDWSCTTFNSDTKEPIGEFCADAGMVGVFLLDEVLKYNPKFNYHIERPWTTTLIKDFEGEVNIVERDGKVQVIGKGNINFIGRQTGL